MNTPIGCESFEAIMYGCPRINVTALPLPNRVNAVGLPRNHGCAARDVLAEVISRSIRARSASSACWSWRNCADALWTAAGVLALTRVATSTWTRWARGNPQVTRSLTAS